MEGDTTYHFVDDRIHAALKRAVQAANGQDVRIGGGVATIQAYLRADLMIFSASLGKPETRFGPVATCFTHTISRDRVQGRRYSTEEI